MKHLLIRSWKLKGKLKALTVLLFLFSILFITYQFLSYVSLTNYQDEEAHALNDLKKKYLLTPTKKQKHEELNPADPENIANYFRKPLISPILGVSPSGWKYYLKPSSSVIGSSESYFLCIHSGHQISWEKVNDDYCDCPDDGSDEPSTSACMNGTFFCTKTANKFPEQVPSYRVNDNICDCCDGSDEVFTKVHCKKLC